MGAEFVKVVDQITKEKEKDIRSVILTGRGKAFSAGGDLEWLMERHRDRPNYNRYMSTVNGCILIANVV